MNPNANSFSFNAGAGSFNPRGAGQQDQGQQYGGQGGDYAQQQGGYGAPGGGYYQQQYGGGAPYGQPGQGGPGGYYQQYNQQQQPYYGGQQQQQQYQQPQQQQYQPQQQSVYVPPNQRAPPSVAAPIVPASAAPSANVNAQASDVQDNWDDEDPAAPAPTPSAGQSKAASDKPAQAKTISIGSSKPAAAEPAPKKEGASSISISIGGKKTEPKAVASEEKAAERSSSPTPAKTAASISAAKATPAASKTAQSSSPAPSAAGPSAAAKKAAKNEEKAAVKTADEIAEQINSAAAEEELKDLFGVDANGQIEGKEHVNIVFVGHVDAGKSTMGGQILVQCGMVDKRTLEKLEKDAKELGRDSWYLSYALDSTPQERNQGKTVEVGRAYFETDKRRYTILDAPGHKSFVPSMISGAAQADVAILVVSARKGEFEAGFDKGGQTREHILLVKTAGVQKLVIAVNKMDEPTVQWDKGRYDEIVSKLTPFLKGTGYNPKTDVTIMPVSGYAGMGIKDRIDPKVAPWYSGPSLLEHLDNMPMANRKFNAPLMMPISEKYKDMGAVVVGKIESGRVKRGDSVVVMPNKNVVEITAIIAENEEEVPTAVCGDNVRFRLRGIDDEDIGVGFVISDVKKPVKAVQHFEAQLIILDHKNIICAGYGAVMHVHTAAEEITLSALLHYYDKKTGRKSKRPPQFAKKGQKIIALVEAAGPVCIERYDDYPQLGRFTLRDEGKTIAIGKVTKLIQKAEDMPDMAALSVGGATAAAALANGST